MSESNIFEYLKRWHRENMSGWRWLSLLFVIAFFLGELAAAAHNDITLLFAFTCDIKHDLEQIIESQKPEQR